MLLAVVLALHAGNASGSLRGESLEPAAVQAALESATQLDVRVSASSDDAEESASGGMSLTSTDLELVTESTVQTVGVRFNGVSVPRGARVLSAYVQFQVDEVGSAQTDLILQGEASDNAPAFTGSARNISSRARTAAAMAWPPPAWPTVGIAGPDQRTPDLAAVIQEIVDRTGWSAGNSLVLIVTGSGKRTAEAFDGVAAAAPLLHVEYGPNAVNLPPAVTIDAPAGGARAEPGELIVFSGTAMDLEDGNLTGTLAWTSSLDGSIGSGGSVSRALSEGVHVVTASATDSGGLTGTGQVAITVGAPTVTIIAPPDGGGFQPGHAISFAGSATDVQDGDLTASLTWASQLDGPIGSGGSFTRSDLSVGVQRISAAVTDSSGLSHQAEVTVTVATDTPVLVGAGDIASCSGVKDDATAALLDGIDGTVLTTGDNVYPDGTDAEFRDCYDPTWGRHKARTRPATGNHDYHVPGAAGYFNYFGPAAGEPTKGYYSYELAGWHIVVLNSECAQVGGCTRTSPQGQWLQADLAAHPAACTLAYWHKPRFSSGGNHGGTTAVHDFWQLLYEAGADVVLNGHEHSYERFGKQNPAAAADPAGIREFVVGTGGAGLYAFGPPVANSEVRNDTTHGVLKLTLDARGYEWEFVPVAGGTFSDFGSDTCFTTNEPPTAAITAPANGATFNRGELVSFAGTGDDAEDGDVTAGLTWTSNLDGVIGSGGSFSTSTLSRGTHVVIVRVTDSGGLTGSAQISLVIDGPPTVTITAPQNGATFDVGTPVSFTGLASDLEEGNLSAGLSWTSSRDGLIGTGGTFSTAALSGGTHVITAGVADGSGLSGSAQVSVTITRPPLVTITAPSNGATVDPGVAVAFAGSASDPEDGDLTSALAWSSSLNGNIGSGGAFTFSNLVPGSHTITASVADTAGSVGTSSITLVVNRAPVVSIAQPLSGAVFAPGQVVSFAGSASDPEDGSLTAVMVWISSLDGSIGSGGSFSTNMLSRGTHVVTAQATDSRGLIGSAQVSVRIDAPPSVSILGPASGSSFDLGDPVSFTGSGADAEAGDISATLSWTSSLDGAFGTGGAFATSALRRGLHLITARATDDAGQTASAQISITIDGPPVVTITAPANGATFTLGAVVSFAGSASDVEDGSLSAGLAWTSNLDGDIGTGGAFTRSDLSLGTHTITASATDSRGKLATSAISITIVQRPLVRLDKRVVAGADDAEEKGSGSVSVTSNDLELVTDSSLQTVGVRFVGLTIPRGATIRAAYVQFQADETQSEATSLTIRGQLAANPAAFSTAKLNVSSRPRTSSSVSWANVPAWNTVGDLGLSQRTPSLTGIVQELVNQPAWANGNAMVFIITGTGHRTAESFEGGSTKAPLLHVEY
ncbi:MAG TPA: Ig-like domain-containing protein [Vicinamibacteria bacterium]|nr:Ig-like domain-containing protein [Vicinamibacteria bacterium]